MGLKGSPRPVTAGEVGQDEAIDLAAAKAAKDMDYLAWRHEFEGLPEPTPGPQYGNRGQRRKGPDQMTRDEAKYCGVCGVKLSDHPFVACWRKLLR